MGDEITVPTLDGDIKYNIPDGTQNNTIFTIKGKGIPVLNKDSRGDQIFEVYIDVPKKLTREQKRALIAYAELLGEKSGKDKKKKRNF